MMNKSKSKSKSSVCVRVNAKIKERTDGIREKGDVKLSEWLILKGKEKGKKERRNRRRKRFEVRRRRFRIGLDRYDVCCSLS